MTGSSNNIGGVVVGALVCGTECSGFESRFMLIFFFSLVEIFLSSRRMSVHNGIPFLLITSALQHTVDSISINGHTQYSGVRRCF